MKRIILIAMFLSVSYAAIAQTRMIINKNNGTADSLLLSDIKNITFKTTSESGIPFVSTLLSGLEAPNSIWVRDNLIYLTETAGRNTGFGGKICLDQYNIRTGQKRQIVNNPQNCDAVVASSTGKVYLTSYAGSIPGDNGRVSVVDTSTGLETQILSILIASEDMFIDGTDNIIIIGSSDTPSAKSLYLLPASSYLNPTVLKTGLGRTWCVSKFGTDIYYSDHTKINRVDTSGGITSFVTKSVMSISFSNSYLYYADYFGGRIGRINLQTKADETILTNLNSPKCLRFDVQSNRIYFIEFGTSPNQFKDGTLKVATW